MNFSFVVPQQKRRSKVPRKLLTLPAKSQVEVESEVFFFLIFRRLYELASATASALGVQSINEAWPRHLAQAETPTFSTLDRERERPRERAIESKRARA